MADNDFPMEVVCNFCDNWSPPKPKCLEKIQKTMVHIVEPCKLPFIEENYSEVDNSNINMEASSLRLDIFLRDIIDYQRMMEERDIEDADLYN